MIKINTIKFRRGSDRLVEDVTIYSNKFGFSVINFNLYKGYWIFGKRPAYPQQLGKVRK